MSWIYQLIVILVVSILAVSGLGVFGTSFIILALWLTVWFGSRRLALGCAIGIGLTLDLLGFLVFGYWTVLLVSLVFLSDYLKEAYLRVSSFWQAILLLFGMSLVVSVANIIFLTGFDYLNLAVRILANVLVGSVLYYMLAVRTRMFQRWLGRII